MQSSLSELLEIERQTQAKEPETVCRYYPVSVEGRCKCGSHLHRYKHLWGNGFFREITYCPHCETYKYKE